MQTLNHEYYAFLLEELRHKQSVFDAQIQLELLGLTETEIIKHNRQEFLKYLANSILQIHTLMEQWLNAVELDWVI